VKFYYNGTTAASPLGSPLGICCPLLPSKNIRINNTLLIILPETWSVILRSEHRLRVSENKVLRIYEPKGDE